jgi:hypothetical protein
MNPGARSKDLIVLTADKAMKLGMEALILRHANLGIRALSFDVFPHPRNDPGVFGGSHDFLRDRQRKYR